MLAWRDEYLLRALTANYLQVFPFFDIFNWVWAVAAATKGLKGLQFLPLYACPSRLVRHDWMPAIEP